MSYEYSGQASHDDYKLARDYVLPETGHISILDEGELDFYASTSDMDGILEEITGLANSIVLGGITIYAEDEDGCGPSFKFYLSPKNVKIYKAHVTWDFVDGVDEYKKIRGRANCE